MGAAGKKTLVKHSRVVTEKGTTKGRSINHDKSQKGKTFKIKQKIIKSNTRNYRLNTKP